MQKQAAVTLSLHQQNTIQYNTIEKQKIQKRQAYKYNYKYQAIISSMLQHNLIQCYTMEWCKMVFNDTI